MPGVRADLSVVAEEFGLGTPVSASGFSDGGPRVARLITDRADVVVKPYFREFELALYSRVERMLNARGLRQAALLARTDGVRGFASSNGLCVQERLPGEPVARPDLAQSTSQMRYQAAYDSALRSVPVPPELADLDTVWTRVSEVDFLVRAFPALPSTLDSLPVVRARSLLKSHQPALASLPRQLVHGGIGPDNVLWDGSTVVSIIDFTPYVRPRLFSPASALYWNHLYDRDPSEAHLAQDVATYAEVAAMPDGERALLPPMLVAEALRRLATPLELAATTGNAPDPRTLAQRHQAVETTLDLQARLQM